MLCCLPLPANLPTLSLQLTCCALLHSPYIGCEPVNSQVDAQEKASANLVVPGLWPFVHLSLALN